MLGHTITQVLQTPSVERVIVSSDSEEILEHARRYGVELLLEPVIENKPLSIVETIARVRRMCKLSASYLMLVQCTSPFVNSQDLEQLAAHTWPSAHYVTHLFSEATAGALPLPDAFYESGNEDPYRHVKSPSPSGMGYVFGPHSAWPTCYRQGVTQRAPHVDINTMEDYQAALKLREDWKIYNMDKHNAQ